MNKNTFSIISLGCPKNLVDSERCVHKMQNRGLLFQEECDGCETVILNTCGFIRSARDEAREYIDALIDLKENGRIGRIVVRGCMTKFEGIEKLRTEFPEVDQWQEIPAEDAEGDRFLLTTQHVGYLRIADGCDRRCSFCAIPSIRGPFKSVPMESLLNEATQLAQKGVRELVIIAQETTFWGKDLTEKPSLTELIRQLQKIDEIRWIRLMYSYPKFFEDDLIELFAEKGKLLPYIDLPIQHANDEILRKMNRQVDRAQMETLLEKLHKKIDNLVLRTSLIAGFPGETDTQFDELIRFVEKWKFQRAGVFPFSPEKGTAAEKMPGRLSEKVVQRRYERLYKICEKHSVAWANERKGEMIEVQIDGPYINESGYKEPDVFIGRTYADAPDIDPIVYVTGRNLQTGSLITCEIVETQGCDLVAVVA